MGESNMWEFSLLKMPVLPHPNPEKHEIPIIGRYIKYCSNLLDIDNKHSLRRWFQWGAIKPVGGKTEAYRYDELSEKYPTMPLSWQNKLRGYSSHLKSDGLEHMKNYYERNSDIYDKKHEIEANRANVLFKGLIQYLEQKVKEHQQNEKEPTQTSGNQRVPKASADSHKRALDYVRETLLELKEAHGDRVMWKDNQHGVTISVKPKYFIERTGDAIMRGYSAYWYQTTVNHSHDWRNLCWQLMVRSDKTTNYNEEVKIGFDGTVRREVCSGNMSQQSNATLELAIGDIIQMTIMGIMDEGPLGGENYSFFSGSRAQSTVGSRKDFNVFRDNPESLAIYKDMHREVLSTIKELSIIDMKDKVDEWTEEDDPNFDRWEGDEEYLEAVTNKMLEYARKFENLYPWEEGYVQNDDINLKSFVIELKELLQWLGTIQTDKLVHESVGSSPNHKGFQAIKKLQSSLLDRMRIIQETTAGIRNRRKHTPAQNRFQRVKQLVKVIIDKLDSMLSERTTFGGEKPDSSAPIADLPEAQMLNKTDDWFNTLKEGGTITSGKAGITNMAYGKGAQKPKNLKKPKVKKPKEEEYLIIPDDPDFWRD